jgi:outer membrane protein assembly factor BamA
LRKIVLISTVLIALSVAQVFAQQSKLFVADFVITGNEITKESVILRECPFVLADTIESAEIESLLQKFTENLIKTSLFNFVDINYLRKNDTVSINISVQERWYLWPYPIIENADRNLSSYLYNREFARINYGLAFDWLNFGGQNDILRFKVRMGYKEQYSIAFFKNAITKNRKSGINFQVDYFRQKSTEYSIENNKPIYVLDDVIYQRKLFSAGVNYVLRPNLDYYFNFGVKFKNTEFENRLLFAEIDTANQEFTSKYLQPYFYFRYDSRDNKVYPINGFFVGFFSGYNHSLKKETGSFALFSINMQYNKQIAASRFSFRIEPSYAIMTPIENSPILFDNRLEFSRDFWIRGYEYYYFSSPHFFNLQNTFSFKLRDFKIHNLPSFLPLEFSKTYTRIYLDAFVDIAHSGVWEDENLAANPMNGKWIYSVGAGISFETYYDRLLQIYVAYLGYSAKTGIFVNYKTPIYKLY